VAGPDHVVEAARDPVEVGLAHHQGRQQLGPRPGPGCGGGRTGDQDQLAEQAGAGLIEQRAGGPQAQAFGRPNSIASAKPLPRRSLISS
jgi:hypothetical protein